MEVVLSLAVLFYSLTLHWFWNIFPWFCIALWMILAVFTALFTWAVFLVGKRFGQAIALISNPFLWVGIEYFRSECWSLKFAWITPGFSQVPNLLLLQTASIFGVYGLSFLILAFNSSLAYLLLSKNWKPTAISIVTVALLHFFGNMQLQNIQAGNIPVGAIQTETSYLPENSKLSQQLAGKAQLIVWPEYSLFEYIDQNTETFKQLAEIAINTQAYLVVGGKERVANNSEVFYNSALLLSPRGEKIGSYYKTNPVQYFADGIPGKNFPVFNTEIGKIGIAICYDMDFPKVFRNLVRNGAEILAVPTYDAMWWSELQHKQHSAMAPARAVEYGRWMVRAASSGISQIIDPQGRVRESLDVGLTGTILGKIDRSDRLTVYAAYGYWLPRLCLVLVVFCFAYELLMVLRNILDRSQ